MSRTGSTFKGPGDPAPIWSRMPIPRRRSSRVLLLGPLVMLLLIAVAIATHSNAARSLRVANVGSGGTSVESTGTGAGGTLRIDAFTTTTTACVLLGSEPLVLPYGWAVRTDPLRIVDWSGRTRGVGGQTFTGTAHEESGRVAFCPAARKYLVVDDFEVATTP